MISFNAIPVGLRVPGSYVEFDSTRATNGLPAGTNRVLLLGQRLATGTVIQNTPKLITDSADADLFFGRGSILARMCHALKAVDKDVECIACAFTDVGGAVAATGTITVTGPATSAGAIALMVAGQPIPVGVASGDTANTIAAAIVAAVNANLDLPVTAAAVGAAVTLTARNAGTSGNEIAVQHSYFPEEQLPAGVALVIVAMANGATDPVLASVGAAISSDMAFSSIALGVANTAILAEAKTELESRWGPQRSLESFLWVGKSGAQGSMSAFGAALNSQLIGVIGNGKSPTPPWEWAAAMAGVTNKAGNIDPARPLQTLPLAKVLPPPATLRLTRAERELLLKDGISTYRTAADGSVTIERAITTYQTNAVGIEDIAYLDVETVRTLSYIRQAVRSRISLKYPRHKLANDGTRFGPGQAIVTPTILTAELLALFRELEEAGIVENLDQFKADLIVQRNATDPNRVDALIPPDLINQFRIFAAQIQFIL